MAGSALLVAGALLHVAAVFIGASAYALIGAPDGLVAMVEIGSPRPALTALAIAGMLLFAAAYGFSGAGLGPRLPARRLVLALVATVLIARGVLLPVAAASQPQLLSGICGRCGSFNGFVILTSAFCLFVGGAYAIGAKGLAWKH
jgi:hypothetical protein